MLDKEEILHIFISVVTLSLAFSLMGLRAGLAGVLANFPIILITLGAGFVLHELAHKFVAQHYGCMAVYRAWIPGLALALGMALMTGGMFVFAAPGAVHIWGRPISSKENAYISVAGPLTNLILGLLFSLFVNIGDPLIRAIAVTGAGANFFLAFFNMIPFPPLDGSKVINYNVLLWGAVIGVAAFFTVF